jgi:hypothetical protein
VAAAVVPVGHALQADDPPVAGEYVFAAQVIAKAESTMDKAKTAPKATLAATRFLKDFFMTTYRV